MANAEKAELAHAPQDRARNLSGLFPGIPVRPNDLVDEAPHLAAEHVVLFGKMWRCHVDLPASPLGEVASNSTSRSPAMTVRPAWQCTPRTDPGPEARSEWTIFIASITTSK